MWRVPVSRHEGAEGRGPWPRAARAPMTGCSRVRAGEHGAAEPAPMHRTSRGGCAHAEPTGAREARPNRGGRRILRRESAGRSARCSETMRARRYTSVELADTGRTFVPTTPGSRTARRSANRRGQFRAARVRSPRRSPVRVRSGNRTAGTPRAVTIRQFASADRKPTYIVLVDSGVVIPTLANQCYFRV